MTDPIDADHGPLTGRQLDAVRADAAAHLPRGKVLANMSLFPEVFEEHSPVALRTAQPELQLEPGDVGVVVHVSTEP